MQAAERSPQDDGRRQDKQHEARQRHSDVRQRGRRCHEPFGGRHEDKSPEEGPYHSKENGIEADRRPAIALRG